MTDAFMAALDRAGTPVRLFIRDDDAGWHDERLHALLDLAAATRVPIDLAVIPAALTPALAVELLARRGHQTLGLHQHGFAHLDHQRSGRKCEFGAARPAPDRIADLARGRERLRAAFGDALDPIFTPPWNRCAPDTAAQLAELGVEALSRDAGAPAQHDLPELPVHLDWTRERRRAAEAGIDAQDAVCMQMAGHLSRSSTIGLMLHHAAMDEAELRLLGGLLARWRAHPSLRWTAMRSLLHECLA